MVTRHTLSLSRLDLANEKVAHDRDVITWQDAVAQAQADDEKHAAQVQQVQAQIAKETQNALKQQISDARTIASTWVRDHPAASSNSGNSNAKGLPDASHPSRSASTNTSATIVPGADIEACAQDYVMAKGWIDWWGKVAPMMKAGAKP